MNTALRFCYELQGFAEIGNEMPAREQWEVIVNKLNEISIDHLIIETDCLMAQEAFVIWLKGYVDISNPLYVNEQQWQIIKDHLQLVFTKVTPSYEDEDDETEIAKRVHDLFEGMQNVKRPFETLDKLDLICACEGTDNKAYCSSGVKDE